MATNPTVVVGSLNDEEIKQTIDSLVEHVNKGMEKIVSNTNSAVDNMKDKLRELGTVSVDSNGSADGGSTRRTKAVNEETQARKQLVQTIDQQASAMQNAVAPKSASDSYQAIISNMRQNVAALGNEIKNMPNMSLDRQFATYMQYERQIEQVRNKIAELRQELNNVGKDPNASRLVIKQITDEIVANQQRIVQLEREQVQATNQIASADSKALANKQAQYEKERQELVQLSAGQREITTFTEKQAQSQSKVVDLGTTQLTQTREELDAQAKMYDARNEQVMQQMRSAQLTQEELEFEKQLAEMRAKKGYGNFSDSGKAKSAQETNELRGAIAGLLGVQEKEIQVVNVQDASYQQLSAYLGQLKKAYQQLDQEGMNASHGRMLADEIQRVSHAMNDMQKSMMRPTSLEKAMGMDEKTLDQIAEKMQKLSLYRSNLDVTDPKQKEEFDQITQKLKELGKERDKLIGGNDKWINSNNAVARSLSYIKNRLAFYLTVGASTQFVKQIIETRAQYEMLERSLGILIDSAQRGTEIFREMQQMALISPFTTIELADAAKQLAAYDIAAKDVVDTTRRIGDIAAAVGIPIERITYALGQIKSYGYMTSINTRMFTRAGIPVVQSLADYYTQLEGRLVRMGDVLDRIKKRAVSYNDVMAVMQSMTDEGGKFFDYQAKMAETLKIQLANLNLAWQNMLNEIGKSNQTLISTPIKTLKELFLHWKDVNQVIWSCIAALGTFAIAQNIATYRTGKHTAALFLQALAGKRLTAYFKDLSKAINSSIANINPYVAAITAVVAIGVGIIQTYHAATNAIKDFNKSLRDGAQENTKGIGKFLDDHKLGGNFDASKLNNNDARKLWGEVRNEIELTSASGEEYVGVLMKEANLQKRIAQGVDYLNVVRSVNDKMQDMSDNAINITQSYSKWWNLWNGSDGLVQNIKDYNDGLQGATSSFDRFLDGFRLFGLMGGLVSAGSNEWWNEHNKRLMEEDVRAFVKSIQNQVETLGLVGKEIDVFYENVTHKMLVDSQLDAKAQAQARLAIVQERIRQEKAAIDDEITYEQNAQKTAITTIQKNVHQARIIELQNAKKAIDEQNLYGEERFNIFGNYLVNNNRALIQRMFENLSDEEKRKKMSSNNVWQTLVSENAKKFADTWKISLDDLEMMLKDPERWLLIINTKVISDSNESIFDELTKADQDIKEAQKKIDRLKKAIKERTVDAIAANEELKEAQEDWQDAYDRGGRLKDKKDVLGDALSKEIQLINNVQSRFKAYQKMGVGANEAIARATEDYGVALDVINRNLAKFGMRTMNASQFANMDLRDMRDLMREQLGVAQRLGNEKGVQALSDAITKLNEDIASIDYKRITDGLNNELSKLKDEYELAVELDANPELGDMFSQMFGIDTDTLSQTFGEAFEKANDLAREMLRKLGIEFEDFDLMSTVIKGDDNNLWMGLKMDSAPVEALLKWQKTFRDMFKKNIIDTEKMLDDYVKKYGDYSDKIAEIEADRLNKLKRLNEAYYTEEMRKQPEYLAKLNAIEQGAAREKGTARFDEFKNSRLYVAMFENLQYASTATLEAIRTKLKDLKSEMGTLSPEQLKQVTQQFQKIDQELIRRNPFKGLLKNARDYAKALGKDGKQAQVAFRNAQKNYDAQLNVVTVLKEQLEVLKAQNPQDKAAIELLIAQIGFEDEKLRKLREELDLASELNDQYNIMRMLFKEQANDIGNLLQKIASNLQSLGELRDTLHDLFGVDLGDTMNAVIDDLSMVGEGINQTVSSAQSGDFVGTAVGVVKTVAGVGDAIASVFGDGAARTRKINKEINRSKVTVAQLETAYNKLERAVNKSLGDAEIGARRSAIANKEAQLAELERQLALEQSKRSKDKDNDAIAQLQENIQSLKYEIEDLKDDLVNNLWGSDVKSAAEEFVDTWVDAWRAGETTLDAIKAKMDDMVFGLVKRAMTSKIVASLLQPMYNELDRMTSEDSKGGVALTTDEIRQLAQQAGITAQQIDVALGQFYGNLSKLGIVSQSAESNKQLSALQQGIQGITEETASALEGYMNSVSQQVYLHSQLLTDIRDAVQAISGDMMLDTQAQMLLQLQQSYAVQVAIQGMLNGWSSADGRAVRVEMM